MDPEAGSDYALALPLEIVQDQAFVLPTGEVTGHCSPHLAHLRADKARPLFLPFFLIAVVSRNGSLDYGLQKRRVEANLLEAVIKPGHIS